MLEAQRFLIRAKIDPRRSTDAFDILDADTGELLGVAREMVSLLTKVLRYVIRKLTLKATIEVREGPDESLLFQVQHSMAMLNERIDVLDAQDQLIGYFAAKMLTLGGGFRVFTPDGREFAEVKARNYHATDFEFLTPDGLSLGTVCRRFEGVAPEFHGPDDRFLITIAEELREQPFAKMLLLATALAVDIVF